MTPWIVPDWVHFIVDVFVQADGVVMVLPPQPAMLSENPRPASVATK